MTATIPFRIRDLVHTYGWDAMVRLAALGIQNLAEAQVLFVDNGATNALDADDGVHGHTIDSPLATIDYAVGLCTASEQSIIIVAPGHAETQATAASCITADVAGIKIVCLGEGSLKPTITLTTSTSAVALTVSAANVIVDNLRVVCSYDAIAKAISVTSDNDALLNIEIVDNAYTTEVAIGIQAVNATDLRIENYKHKGFLTGDACTDGISLNGVTRCQIINPQLRGKFSIAAINMTGAACAGIIVRNPVIENGTTALSLDVVDTITGSKWSVIDGFDVVGGYKFNGGSGSALAASDVSSVSTQTDKIDAATLDTTPVAYSLATYTAGGAGGIGTQLPASTSLYDVVKHLSKVDTTVVADDDLTTYAVDGSLLSHIMTAGADTSDFQASTDSLEAISNALATTDGKVDTVDGIVDGVLVDTDEVQKMAPRCVSKTVTNLSAASGNTNLFTISGGPVKITSIVGIVTNAIKATAIECQIVGVPTAPGVEVDITAVVDINAAAIGTTLTPGATFGAAMVLTPNGVIGDMGFDVIHGNGIIAMELNANGDADDEIIWYIRYEPLVSGAVLAAA